jgi:hypothetical protein
MQGEKVILDGRYFYEGHKDAWRAGVVVTEPVNHGPGTHFVTVECQPRGRERKVRRMQACAEHLLRDTPEVRAKLQAHGIDPNAQPS